MFFVWRVIIQNEHRFEADNFELLLKNLTRLRELYLIFVNISSTIPLNLSSYLTILSLDNTELYRTLPEGAFHLSILEYLYSSYNPQLPIMFPTIKWNTSASLMELDLSGLNATGSIPKPLWNLTNIDVRMGASTYSQWTRSLNTVKKECKHRHYSASTICQRTKSLDSV